MTPPTDPSPPARHRILVTGDIVREIHLYQGSRSFASDPSAMGNRMGEDLGGAFLLHRILERAQPGISLMDLAIPDPLTAWPKHLEAHALYAPFESGFKSDPPPPSGTKLERIWRVTQALGYGMDSEVPPGEPPLQRADREDPTPPVWLIDDGGAGFRTLRARDRWPDRPMEERPLPPWVVMKLSKPLCESDLWRHLASRILESGDKPSSQLVVIVSADELRRDGAAINRGLSWERTVADTCQVLRNHPRLGALLDAAHVLVVYRREGALWIRGGNGRPLSHSSNAHPEGILMIDSAMAEGEWTTQLRSEGGTVFGHLSVFSAAIGLELANQPANPQFIPAIRRGLTATRELRLWGHGVVSKHQVPAFPLERIGAVLTGGSSGRKPHQPQDRFVEIKLPCETGHRPLDSGWTIASQNDSRENTPLYGLGFQTAIYGPGRLADVPYARFGELLSVDRDEIEALRSLRHLIRSYENRGPQKSPLSIGAFGPPGAGKSFGIKQIAREILGKEVPILEFNLSQFDNPGDLIGAFHQVRDMVLSGRTPIVFWDEFDSQKFRWLQFFLAPMQDGKFQSGQLTHTLGKCIFVFAGATSWDFEHFGPAPEPADSAESGQLETALAGDGTRRETRERDQLEFREKKGPDFVSRLGGHINVDGPNRRLLYHFATGNWDRPDPADVTFPIRRALLLRSFLKAKDTDTLDIDRNLLNALIRLPRYRHGARSMEKTVATLRVPHAPLRPAQLPSPQVLRQHLDSYEAFQALLTETDEFLTRENVRKLAAAIHENYRRKNDPQSVQDTQFLSSFDALDRWGKATNSAAAKGIPHVLAVAGLCVKAATDSKDRNEGIGERLRQYLEPLSMEEHARWMAYLIENGWLQSGTMDPAGNPVRKNEQLLHHSLIPFDDLSERERQKDQESILNLPEAVELVGFEIALFDDLTL